MSVPTSSFNTNPIISEGEVSVIDPSTITVADILSNSVLYPSTTSGEFNPLSSITLIAPPTMTFTFLLGSKPTSFSLPPFLAYSTYCRTLPLTYTLSAPFDGLSLPSSSIPSLLINPYLPGSFSFTITASIPGTTNSKGESIGSTT